MIRSRACVHGTAAYHLICLSALTLSSELGVLVLFVPPGPLMLQVLWQGGSPDHHQTGSRQRLQEDLCRPERNHGNTSNECIHKAQKALWCDFGAVPGSSVQLHWWRPATATARVAMADSHWCRILACSSSFDGSSVRLLQWHDRPAKQRQQLATGITHALVIAHSRVPPKLPHIQSRAGVYSMPAGQLTREHDSRSPSRPLCEASPFCCIL